MKRIILVFSLASIMMGCSTAYRSGQTPDDVYFSPVREESGYVNVDEDRSYRESDIPLNDRYLRMKAMGGSRWRSFDDDFTYWNNPYWNNTAYLDFYPSFRGGMGMGMGMGLGFSPFMGNPFFGPTFGTGLYYNPFSPYYFGSPVIVFNNPKYISPRSYGPRTYNLNNYVTPPNFKQISGGKYSSFSNKNGSYYINNGGSGTPRGGYNPRGNGSSGSPTRTFSNNGSGSGFGGGSSNSSSGGSSSGSAPVRSFGRGGN
jgi:hypothetical protein